MFLLQGNAEFPPSWSYNGQMRAYPDVSFNGHNYLIYVTSGQTGMHNCLFLCTWLCDSKNVFPLVFVFDFIYIVFFVFCFLLFFSLLIHAHR